MESVGDKIFDKMAEIINRDAKKNGWLKSYEVDFWEHDKNIITHAASDNSEFIWVVRDTGSHLHRIDVDEINADRAMASIEYSAENKQIFHIITADGQTEIHPVDLGEARVIIRQPRPWRTEVDGICSWVFYKGKPVASIYLGSPYYADGKTRQDARVELVEGVNANREIMTALAIIISSRVVSSTGSMYSSVGDVSLGDNDFYKLFENTLFPEGRGVVHKSKHDDSTALDM